MKYFLFAALVLLSSLLAFPIELAPSWRNYRIDGRQLTVFAQYQSPSGMVWLGCDGGLFAFDGFSTRPVRTKSGEAFGAQVYAIAPRPDGRFWLGTNNGLYACDPGQMTIVPVQQSVSEVRALALCGSTLYIGTLSGLYAFDTGSSRLTRVPGGMPHEAVYALLAAGSAPDAALYIGTYDGLCRLAPGERRVSSFRPGAELPRDRNFFVNAIVPGPTAGTLTLGVEGALMFFNTRTAEFTPVPAYNGQSVKDIAYTARGEMVVATDNGLLLAPDLRHPEIFTVCRHDARDPSSIADNTVWSVSMSPGGQIFAGTAMGLSVGETDSPVRTVQLSEITGRNDGQQIYSMLRDSRGRLWLGGNNGLIGVWPDGSSRWFTPADKGSRLSHNRVRDIMESADGHLWVATDGSLNVFDPPTGNFDIRRLTDSTGRHNANWAYGLVEDTVTHSLWTGAYLGGVLVADSRAIAAAGAPAVATRAYNSSNGLAADLVSSIAQDSRRNKWVLLFRDSCLTRFDARTGAMSRTDISRATGSRAPVMIAAGPDGRLWCAFAGGVVPIDHGGIPGRAIFLPGTDADAVPEALGNVNGCVWMSESSGRVWSIDPRTAAARLLPLPPARYTSIYYDPQLRRVLLGTTDAIVAADPRRLAATGTDTLRIAGVNRLGQPEAPGTRRITLPFGTNSLSVELATFNFSSLAARHPAYRLADLDSAWTVLPDGSNTVLLRNIPEGPHRLEVRLLDAGGAPVVFDVRVMPPWHRSWWAMALYVLAAAGAILTLLMVLRRRQKRRIEGIRRSNAIQNVGSRLDFLANIAHDFKTPLSMIIGPLSRLRDSIGLPSDADVRRSVETAYQNALRLNNMVHHSVEYDRAEAQASSPVIYSQIDAAEFCRNIVNRFAEAYPAMTFSFRAEPERIPAVADAIKLESILTNLLSNAMKYAGPKAAVEVVADGADGKMLHLSVTDNGPGIDARCQRLVFQRLFRAPDTACEAEGTGIGLYLVRRYAQQHHGDVELLSPVADGHGARFTVTLPLSAGTEGAHAGAGAPESDASPDDKRPRVLVVDDNRQIAEFLTDLLGDQYRCAVAHDGRAGLELIPAFRPDLVIADEMMPVMTGTEMCRRLRASGSAGASVPVIILSAKTDPELERDTVRAGADLLITKPFDAPLLRERVARIIAARDARRRDARVEAITNRPAPDTDALESDSERRLAAVTDFIEANISDPQLNVALVCQRTGMQSKSLYRLVKNLTGLSPVDYIRQTRLRRAALLLGQKRFTVSEVMYMVGFSSPSYFSKCFTAMYGVRPSQYEPPAETPSQS